METLYEAIDTSERKDGMQQKEVQCSIGHLEQFICDFKKYVFIIF